MSIEDHLKKLWLCRGFIVASVKREFQLKYHNSLLGVAWAIINPLAMIVIYMVVFSKIMQAKLPGVGNTLSYSIYLCSGIITWFFFSEIVLRGINVFNDYASLIKKLNFPRLCLPLIVISSAGLNFIITFVIFALLLCLCGNFPGWAYLGIFPVLAIQVSFAIGLGVFFGIFNVFFRDMGQFFVIFLQFWFWFTPVVYSDNILPSWARTAIKFNPMYSIVNAYHDIFIYQSLPDWLSLLPVTVVSVVICALAVRLFRKHSDEIVDEL